MEINCKTKSKIISNNFNKFLLISVSIFFGFFGLAKSSWAACTGASPNWTCTADSTSAQVNSCISGATNGDTINFAAGTHTWTSLVLITKGIHLKGAGAGSTRIEQDTGDHLNYLIQFDPANQSLNEEFELTGFTIDSNDHRVIRLGNDCTNLTKVQTKVNIHDNVFLGSVTENGNVHYINTYCTAGVVWRNTFHGTDQQFTSNGWGVIGEPIRVLAPDVRGTENALFIEDNIIYYDTVPSYMKDSQFGAISIVWRYNTIYILQNPTYAPLIDWHGAYGDGTGGTSSYGDEIYGNNIAQLGNGSGSFRGWSGARGSTGYVFYNNAITSGSVGNGTFCGGYGCGHYDSEKLRVYNWMQVKNMNIIITTEPDETCPDLQITCDGLTNSYSKLNWNAFSQKVPFTGATGVGCGSSLPNPTGYAERVGYWVTSQSCSSVSGLVGDIVNNPARGIITGSLYEIQNGQWVKIYTPYTYPHPLRAGVSDTTPPAAPNGLNVQ